MKKFTILSILILSMAFLQETNAQVKLNVNLNVGNQPAWGPVGYDHVDYYYLPDIDAYYNVPQRQFIYLDGRDWVFANSLPPRYSGYNLYNGYKVVVNEPRPYLRGDVYRVKYGKYKGNNGPRQVIIRDSHDERYKNNGRNDNEHEDNGNGKNKGRGNGKDKDHNEKDHGKGKGHDKGDRD